jgi:hypothetical protein
MNLTIMFATEADQERLRRLAELDSKPVPRGDVLLAEAQGRLVAAMSVDGSVIADPFERTAGVVEVLRTQLEGRPALLRPSLLTRLFSRPAAT